MVTMVGLEFDVKTALCDLIELDFDAIAAYNKALEKLSSSEYKKMFSEFKRDHERHIEELTVYLKEKDIRAPIAGDMKEILLRGKVYIGSLFGDRSILRAMQGNEVDTNNAYKRMLSFDHLDETLTDILARGYDDERRHLKWIKTTLQEGDENHESV